MSRLSHGELLPTQEQQIVLPHRCAALYWLANNPVRHATHPRQLVFLSAVTLLLAIAAYKGQAEWHLHRRVAVASQAERTLPRQILWIWERPEDLRALDPASTGVAVLEATILLGGRANVIPRHQPTLLPAGIQKISVVRIETSPDFAARHEDTAVLHDTVAVLQQIAQRPGIIAVQIDFDARRSERAFYRELLTQLRQTMAPTLPLDITALVSWCSTDDWIADLPVNAATPMFFRMEPDRRRVNLATAPAYRIHEPLCQTSLGVSTSEPWPAEQAGKRIFIFPDHGWSNDLALLHATEANHP